MEARSQLRHRPAGFESRITYSEYITRAFRAESAFMTGRQASLTSPGKKGGGASEAPCRPGTAIQAGALA